jgi:hypothetical protein
MAKPPADLIYSSKFLKLIQAHLKNLGWKEADLCQAVHAISGREKRKLFPAHFTRWKEGERGVTRFLVVRIAIAIALEYEKRLAQGKKMAKPETQSFVPEWSEDLATDGLDYADWVTQGFLAAAGYVGGAIQMAEPHDLSWAEVAETKVVKVGWVHCPPWSYMATTGQVAGHAIRITQQVLQLLGLTPSFRQPAFLWDELPAAVREREIHLVIPVLMKAPWRRADFLLTDELSGQKDTGTKFGIKLLGHKAALTSAPDVDLQRFQLGYVREEIGQLAKFMLDDIHDTKELDTWESAEQWITETNVSPPRLLASEESTCEATRMRHAELLKAFQPDQLKDKKFGLAFGLHPHENEFARSINECLPFIRDRFESFIAEQESKLIAPS